MFFITVTLFSCNSETVSFKSILSETEAIEGKANYLASPYITAGNRVYSVGHQNGSFPEIGWHIKDEMGGIWNHPIKLMDGFDASIKANGTTYLLNEAEAFINYPFANKHQFSLKALSFDISRIQFVPDDLQGMIIQYEIQNNSETVVDATFEFVGHVDLRATWLGEEADMTDTEDMISFDTELQGWVSKDSKNDWYCYFGSADTPISYSEIQTSYKGLGVAANLNYALKLDPGSSKTITFYIAGSYQSKSVLEENYLGLKNNETRLLTVKKDRYKQINEQSKLTTPDEDFNKIYRWIKYNSDWFVRSVPEIGTGIAAGYPDYPWWFGCDSEYALLGYLATGQFELTKQNIELLSSISQKTNDNGRIVHEVSTNGVVFNKGNTNETPQFTSLIWNAYLWTGEEHLLVENFPLIEKGMNWLLNEKDTNKNLFPEGAGMMEIHGLESEMIDVASYTYKGFKDASKIAGILKKDSLANYYADIAEQIKDKINTTFWSEKFGSYADFIGEDKETIKLIDDAIIRADTLNKPWAIEELKATKKYILENPSAHARPFVLHHNWVVNTPLEMNIADTSKAKLALETGRKFVNPFGVFVTGIDRDESAGKEEGSFQGSKQFSYTGAVMTLPTGVSAISENNYGNPDRALDYLQRMGKSFSFALPGSIYEVSPDYGMFAQAWNIYSYAYPVVQQFFGIQPNAAKKEVVIKPLMPSHWQEASLERVKIGSNFIAVFYTVTDEGLKIKVDSKESGWNISVIPPKSFKNLNKEVKGEFSASYLFTRH